MVMRQFERSDGIIVPTERLVAVGTKEQERLAAFALRQIDRFGSFASLRANTGHVRFAPYQRKFAGPADTSHSCQSTKSLRSSPLRGGRSREAGCQSRGHQ
jgi:hypothetical protein